MHYPILKLIFNWGISASFTSKQLSELSGAPGGHPKKISPYDLHHSTHLLDLDGSLQMGHYSSLSGYNGLRY